MASTKKTRGERTYLKLTSKTIKELEIRAKTCTLGEFMVEAFHLVSQNLVEEWAKGGHNTPSKIIAQMRQKEMRDRLAVAEIERKENGGNRSAAIIDDDHDPDIPF